MLSNIFSSVVARTASARPERRFRRIWREAWPPDRRTALLVAGDALAFLLFAFIGRRSHQEATGLDALGQIAWTALPFALGWFMVAPWLGAFRRSQSLRPTRMLASTELAWLATWPVALILRWALSSDHQIPVSFALVVLTANAVLLGIWRVLFALLASGLHKKQAGK